MQARGWTVGVVVFAALGCGPGGDGATDAGAPPVFEAGPGTPAPASLTVAPAMATLEVPLGTTPTLLFQVDARLADGSAARNVPASMTFDLAGGGSFRGTTFTASGTVGGAGTVRASWRGAQATAPFTLRLRIDREAMGVDPALAARARDALPRATADTALRPEVVYPQDGTVVPPNLYGIEWQWRPVRGAELYLVTFATPTVSLRVVTRGSQLTVAPEDWRSLVGSSRGRTLEVTVTAARATDLSRAGSATVRVTLGPQDLLGGLYYFNADEDRANQGVHRYDFGVPVLTATRFLTAQGAGGCVGCHILSRRGDRMLTTFEGGAGYLAAWDVASPRTPLLGGARGPQRGAFSAWFDGDRSFLSVYDNAMENPGDRYNGQLRVYDARTGMPDDARQVPLGAGHRATHVDVAPDGVTAVYVDYADTSARPIRMEQGSIRVVLYDPTARRWGPARTLVPFADGVNNYYPTLSPDGQWVLFNRARGSAYDNVGASVWVVPTDGSRAPVELARANLRAMLGNSWARWAPFVQRDELGTARLWFTFSSRRDYGLRLVGLGRPQLWMAAFRPVEAMSGRDGSSPAFWLPFQDPRTRNHTASWTEAVVPRNCERDSDCADATLRCNATRRTCEALEPPG